MRILTWSVFGLVFGALLGACGCSALYIVNRDTELGHYIPLGVYAGLGAAGGSLIGLFFAACTAATLKSEDEPGEKRNNE